MIKVRYELMQLQSLEDYFRFNKLPVPYRSTKSAPATEGPPIATSEVYAGTFGELSAFNFDTFKAPVSEMLKKSNAPEDSPVVQSLAGFGRASTETPRLTDSQKLRPLVPIGESPAVGRSTMKGDSILESNKNPESLSKTGESKLLGSGRLIPIKVDTDSIDMTRAFKRKPTESDIWDAEPPSRLLTEQELTNAAEEVQFQKSKVQKLQNDKTVLKKHIDDLTDELKSARKSVTELEMRLVSQQTESLVARPDSQLVDEVARLTKELERTRQQLTLSVNERDNYQVLWTQAHNKAQETTQAVFDLKFKLQALENDRNGDSASRNAKRELGDALAELDVLKSRLKTMENERKVFEPMFEAAKKQVLEVKNESDMLRFQVMTLESERNTLVPMNEQLKKKLQEAFGQIEGLRSQVLSLSQERNLKNPGLEDAAFKIQEAVSILGKLTADLAAVGSTELGREGTREPKLLIGQALVAINRLDIGLGDKKPIVEVQREQINSQEAEILELQGTIQNLVKLVEDMKADAKLRDDKLLLARSEVETRLQKQSELKGEIGDLRAALEKMESQLDEVPILETDLKRAKDELREKGELLAEREREIRMLHSRVSELASQKDLSEKQRSLAAIDISNSQVQAAENTQLHLELSSLRTQNLVLENRLNNLTVSQQDKEYYAMKQAQAQEKIGALESKISQLERQLEERVEAEGEVGFLKKQKEKSEAQAREIIAEYEKNRKLFVKKIDDLQRRLLTESQKKEVTEEEEHEKAYALIEMDHQLIRAKEEILMLRNELKKQREKSDSEGKMAAEIMKRYRRSQATLDEVFEAQISAVRQQVEGLALEVAKPPKTPQKVGSTRSFRDQELRASTDLSRKTQQQIDLILGSLIETRAFSSLLRAEIEGYRFNNLELTIKIFLISVELERKSESAYHSVNESHFARVPQPAYDTEQSHADHDSEVQSVPHPEIYAPPSLRNSKVLGERQGESLAFIESFGGDNFHTPQLLRESILEHKNKEIQHLKDDKSKLQSKLSDSEVRYRELEQRLAELQAQTHSDNLSQAGSISNLLESQPGENNPKVKFLMMENERIKSLLFSKTKEIERLKELNQ